MVVCACTEGLGAHGLIEFGRRQFVRRDRHGSFKDVLAGVELLFLAPNVTGHRRALLRSIRAPLPGLGLRCGQALEGLHPDGARAAVFPSSALVDAGFRPAHGPR